MLLELPRFEHIDVTTPEHAFSCLRRYGEKASIIAGGTDLLGLLKDRVEGPELKIPEVLINIKTIPGLNQIAEEEAGLRIGAAVTLSRLENSDVIRRNFPILSQAAHQVGTPQLRNMGTLGGNLCQRPRCMYFRHPHFLCFKKGGNKCFAVTGEHRDYHAIMKLGKCVMAHPSDTAPALIALKAEGVIAGSEGEKKVPLREFFLGANSHHETVLKSDQFLREVQIPHPRARTRQFFLKQRVRHSADFALSSVSVVAELTDGVCKDISLVLGGIAPLPVVADCAEEMVRGKRLEEGLIAEAAEAALEGAKPLPMNLYKNDLTRALVRRALVLVSREVPAV
jgi:xanthine dehydrogenase YagS FAD-binding subunit